MLPALLMYFLAFCASSVVEAKKCTKDHPLVGTVCPLESFQHEVNGTVVIRNDCSFFIRNFKYDGEGPEVYITGFSKKLKEGGRRRRKTKEILLKHLPVGKAYDGSRRLRVKLPKGTTWDDIKHISVWCVEYGIDFGSTPLPSV